MVLGQRLERATFVKWEYQPRPVPEQELRDPISPWVVTLTR